MQRFPGTDPTAYRALARRHASTVTVVTVCRTADPLADTTRSPYDGFTATAVLMVSIDPPLVLVSATNASSAFPMLRDAASFVVNVLAADQSHISQSFAGPSDGRDSLWDTLAHTLDDDGVPVIDGATGAFSVRVTSRVPAGDHTLVLGEVTAVHLGESAEPLVYYDRTYGRFVG